MANRPTDEYLVTLTTNTREYIVELEAQVERLRAENRTLSRIENGEVWYWGDDDEDHPESLSCPAIVEPDVIRRWVALEAEITRLKTALINTRNAVRLASVGNGGIPWPDVSETDVDSYVTFVRKQREAAEAAKEKP